MPLEPRTDRIDALLVIGPGIDVHDIAQQIDHRLPLRRQPVRDLSFRHVYPRVVLTRGYRACRCYGLVGWRGPVMRGTLKAVIASAAKQSSPSARKNSGLLRSARNDEVGSLHSNKNARAKPGHSHPLNSYGSRLTVRLRHRF